MVLSLLFASVQGFSILALLSLVVFGAVAAADAVETEEKAPQVDPESLLTEKTRQQLDKIKPAVLKVLAGFKASRVAAVQIMDAYRAYLEDTGETDKPVVVKKMDRGPWVRFIRRYDPTFSTQPEIYKKSETWDTFQTLRRWDKEQQAILNHERTENLTLLTAEQLIADDPEYVRERLIAGNVEGIDENTVMTTSHARQAITSQLIDRDRLPKELVDAYYKPEGKSPEQQAMSVYDTLVTVVKGIREYASANGQTWMPGALSGPLTRRPYFWTEARVKNFLQKVADATHAFPIKFVAASESQVDKLQKIAAQVAADMNGLTETQAKARGVRTPKTHNHAPVTPVRKAKRA